MLQAQHHHGRGHSHHRTDSLSRVVQLAQTFDEKKKPLEYLCSIALHADPKAAANYAQEFMRLGRQHKKPEGIFMGHLYMGRALFHQGEFGKALASYDSAEYYTGFKKEKDDIIGIEISRNDAYEALGDYTNALKSCHKVLDLLREFPEKKSGRTTLSSVLASIGSIHGNLGNHEKSLSYFRQSIEQARLSKSSNLFLARRLMSAAVVFKNLGRYEEAKNYYLEAQDLYKESGDKLNAARNLNYLGDVTLKLDKDPKHARDYYARGLKLSEEVNDKVAIAESLNDLATVEAQAGNFASVEPMLRKALALSRETRSKQLELKVLHNLAKAFEEQQNLKEALTSYKQSQRLKDSINLAETSRKVAQLEGQYAVEKKDTEIALLNQEKELKEAVISKQNARQYLLFGIIGFVGLLAMGLLLAYRQKQRTNYKLQKAYTNLEMMQEELLQKEKALFAKQLSELELKALRAQMNPHFIFNCLNAIQSLILQQNRERAVKYLQKFSRLIRQILDNSQKSFTSLSDEITILELYLQLEALRMGDRFSFTVEVDPEINTEEVELPSMVLQPLAENAIWHGLMPLDGRGELHINFIRNDSGFSCRIADTGIGLDMAAMLKENKISSHTSKGLELIRQRLRTWSQSRTVEASLELRSNTEARRGTVAELLIRSEITQSIYA